MHPDLPPFSRFPLAREHARSAEIIAETAHFISKLDVTAFKSQAQRQKFLDDDLTQIITRGIPDGQYDKMLTMARANILYFIADDCFESTSEEKHTFMKEIKDIFKGHTASNESALARSFRDLYQNIAAASTGLEYQQYVRLSYQWLRSNEETVNHTEITAQLKWRRVNSGGYFFFAFARYAVGIYLSDEQIDDPLLAKCADIAIDISSYEKELENQTHSDAILPPNLVAIILAHGVDDRQFTTPLEVKLFLREEIERYEEMLYAALSAALGGKIRRQAALAVHPAVYCRWEYMVLAIYWPLQPSGKTGVEKDYSSRRRGGLH
ncbi:hypothetical protein B0H13DRAFT_2024947 [Mycena leptocephala]|nr:hypothetical protein B0H13DRAFT_2024947 [Mycena leptocephala]